MIELKQHDWQPEVFAQFPTFYEKLDVQIKHNGLDLMEFCQSHSYDEKVQFYMEPTRLDFDKGKLLLSSNIELSWTLWLKDYREMPANNIHACFILLPFRGTRIVQGSSYADPRRTSWVTELKLRWYRRDYPVYESVRGEYRYSRLKQVPKYLSQFTTLALSMQRRWQDWFNEFGETKEVD